MNKKKIILYIVFASIVAVVLVADLVSKHFTTTYEVGTNIIPYLVNFKSTQNTGAAWSLFAGGTTALIVVSFIAIILILVYLIFSKQNSYLFFVSIALIFSGALGNLIDRLAFGYVRDFIQFDFWKTFPIFNVADIALTVGVVCLCIYFLIGVIKDYKNKKKNNGN